MIILAAITSLILVMILTECMWSIVLILYSVHNCTDPSIEPVESYPYFCLLPRDEVELHFDRSPWRLFPFQLLLLLFRQYFHFIFSDLYFYHKAHDSVLLVPGDFMYLQSLLWHLALDCTIPINFVILIHFVMLGLPSKWVKCHHDRMLVFGWQILLNQVVTSSTFRLSMQFGLYTATEGRSLFVAFASWHFSVDSLD